MATTRSATATPVAARRGHGWQDAGTTSFLLRRPARGPTPGAEGRTPMSVFGAPSLRVSCSARLTMPPDDWHGRTTSDRLLPPPRPVVDPDEHYVA